MDEQCGRLVEPGDTGSLIRTLRLLIEDPQLRRELGANGPVRARKLSLPKTKLEELAAVLAELPGNNAITARDGAVVA